MVRIQGGLHNGNEGQSPDPVRHKQTWEIRGLLTQTNLPGSRVIATNKRRTILNHWLLAESCAHTGLHINEPHVRSQGLFVYTVSPFTYLRQKRVYVSIPTASLPSHRRLFPTEGERDLFTARAIRFAKAMMLTFTFNVFMLL